jgi:predicted 3-demethylubiquinone-9 3-methyltransferase (glyoxalase superfamily)
LWARLSEGGSEGPCAWLKDKFGLSWQIVPRALVTLLNDPDPRKAARAMQAMMTMNKIDINRLQQVHDQI